MVSYNKIQSYSNLVNLIYTGIIAKKKNSEFFFQNVMSNFFFI